MAQAPEIHEEQTDVSETQTLVFYPSIRPALAAKEPDEEPASQLWLITFADIMGLVLTFFVMLYAMSSPNEDKFKMMTRSLQDGLSREESQRIYSGPEDSIRLESQGTRRGLDLGYLRTLIEEAKSQQPALDPVIVAYQSGLLRLVLPGTLLFDPSKVGVSAQGQKTLFALGNLFSRIRNRIEVVAHVEPESSPAEGEFSSKWDMALARALNVAGVLENLGYDKAITARADTGPIMNEAAEGYDPYLAASLAQRVDIIIMSDDGSSRSFLQIGN